MPESPLLRRKQGRVATPSSNPWQQPRGGTHGMSHSDNLANAARGVLHTHHVRKAVGEFANGRCAHVHRNSSRAL